MTQDNTVDQSDIYLKTHEVAEIFRCHPETIRLRDGKKGFPKSIKPFGNLLWSKRAIEKFIQDKEVEA